MTDIKNKKGFTEVFVGENGKKGVKTIEGSIIVPANYDEIAYTYTRSIPKGYPYVAIRDGKMGLVAPDGNGTELTAFVYDRIDMFSAMPYGWLWYQKDGSKQFGIMTIDGKEVMPCKLDSYGEDCQTIYFTSGDRQGLLQTSLGLLLEPIYDDIEVEDPDSQIIFTLNGEKGYVKEDGTFVPQSLSETLSEDEWDYILDECIRDQYDFD
ncbi:MAG: WG repeat-containing protein [Bacteroidales bacterium]|nr:WG repeat-containing protein [Bacteroidales bacterium]